MTVRLSALRSDRPLPPGRFLVLISVRSWVNSRAVVRLEELHQLKHLMTSSGIEPAIFRLVAYCLNQVRYRVPHLSIHKLLKNAFNRRNERICSNYVEIKVHPSIRGFCLQLFKTVIILEPSPIYSSRPS
jgi:hypothetical protein